MDEFRATYKEAMNELISGQRTGYREMIEGRKEKEGALLELVRQDKADVNGLKTAIE